MTTQQQEGEWKYPTAFHKYHLPARIRYQCTDVLTYLRSDRGTTCSYGTANTEEERDELAANFIARLMEASRIDSTNHPLTNRYKTSGEVITMMLDSIDSFDTSKQVQFDKSYFHEVMKRQWGAVNIRDKWYAFSNDTTSEGVQTPNITWLHDFVLGPLTTVELWKDGKTLNCQVANLQALDKAFEPEESKIVEVRGKNGPAMNKTGIPYCYHLKTPTKDTKYGRMEFKYWEGNKMRTKIYPLKEATDSGEKEALEKVKTFRNQKLQIEANQQYGLSLYKRKWKPDTVMLEKRDESLENDAKLEDSTEFHSKNTKWTKEKDRKGHTLGTTLLGNIRRMRHGFCVKNGPGFGECTHCNTIELAEQRLLAMNKEVGSSVNTVGPEGLRLNGRRSVDNEMHLLFDSQIESVNKAILSQEWRVLENDDGSFQAVVSGNIQDNPLHDAGYLIAYTIISNTSINVEKETFMRNFFVQCKFIPETRTIDARIQSLSCIRRFDANAYTRSKRMNIGYLNFIEKKTKKQWLSRELHGGFRLMSIVQNNINDVRQRLQRVENISSSLPSMEDFIGNYKEDEQLFIVFSDKAKRGKKRKQVSGTEDKSKQSEGEEEEDDACGVDEERPTKKKKEECENPQTDQQKRDGIASFRRQIGRDNTDQEKRDAIAYYESQPAP
jgi:hypothetical protein